MRAMIEIVFVISWASGSPAVRVTTREESLSHPGRVWTSFDAACEARDGLALGGLALAAPTWASA